MKHDHLIRNQWGELFNAYPHQSSVNQTWVAACQLVALAAEKGKIPAAYNNMEWVKVNAKLGNKRLGTALHHEIYDITEDARLVLVCCRATEGTQYGIKGSSQNSDNKAR